MRAEYKKCIENHESYTVGLVPDSARSFRDLKHFISHFTSNFHWVLVDFVLEHTSSHQTTKIYQLKSDHPGDYHLLPIFG